MNKKLIALLFLLIYCGLQAQDVESTKWPKQQQKYFESANSFYEEKLYTFAYERYDSLLKLHPNDLYLKYVTGISAIYISDKHKIAEKYLTEVKEKNKKAADLDFYFALLYHKTYQFEKSLALIETLLKTKKLNAAQEKELNKVARYCRNAIPLIEKPIVANIKNISSPPNTKGAEYSPVVTADEETIFFTYRGTKSLGGLRDLYGKQNPLGIYFEDVFLSQKKDGKWQEPRGLITANTVANDAVIAISNDGQKLFLFRSNETDGGDIYESKLTGSEFSEPEKLKGDINSTSWEGSVSLSSNQNKIIFASERPGGFGGKDLYVATKADDGSWGKVKNLGKNINTEFDDDAPFLHPDGRTLVFSSEGHNSMGGYDIFLSDLDEIDSTWKKPTNIGHPINTTDDDIFYVLSADGKRGYFASAREGGSGDKDIYVVEPAVASKKSVLTVVKGKLTENLKPYEGRVEVFLENGKMFGGFYANSSTGNYLISVPSGYNYKFNYYHPIFGDRPYEIRISAVDGYAEKIININFGDADTIPKLKMVDVVPGDSVKKFVDPSMYDNTSIANTQTNKTTEMTTATTTTKSNENNSNGNTIISNLSVNSVAEERIALLNNFGNKTLPNLNFYVQVGAYRKPQNFPNSKLAQLGGSKQAETIMGDVQLIVVNKLFGTWNEAETYCKKIKSVGYSDAFITANYNGKRYYLTDLIKEKILEQADLK